MGKVAGLSAPRRAEAPAGRAAATSGGKVAKSKRTEVAWDSDGEEMHVLCPECGLPLGDMAYVGGGQEEGPLMHGECKAQLLLQLVQRDNDARLKEDAVLKREQRVKYDLGWKIQRVPRNLAPARKLGCCPLPEGLCALTWQESSRTVGVVPTIEQASSVNLEYLSIALQVRRKDGKEPMFSLDPKLDSLTNDPLKLWQAKRFEPAWLEGTSVGEVMFQADYHLKELSMGELHQPVVGMKSAFDLSEEQDIQKEWCAREWFVVNKAEVQLTEGNVMIPRVKMGVEARETCKGPHGLEDVPITRPDHPLVKYADAFSHYFDLIAERKSVVSHLRELAKASVLAKFLTENEARLDEPWFSLAGEPGCVGCKEIPQLWNEQRFSQILVSDGKIATEAIGGHMHGVYGGVEMGLERLGRVPARVPVAKVSTLRTPALSSRLISTRAGVQEMPLPTVPAAPMAPKGVDLSLDRFDLASATEVEAQAPEGSWAGKDLLGNSFWRGMSDLKIKKDDQSLLREIFSPQLCDRRDDGDLFVPPDTGLASVSALRALLKEEAETRRVRKEHFLGADFDESDAGVLFPASWRPAMGVANSRAAERPVPGSLHPRSDYRAEAAKLLKSARPAFHKTAEDGMHYRIYRMGSLEVRTTQEVGGPEDVGAVFSTRGKQSEAQQEQGPWRAIAKTDKIVKAVEYVEHAQREGPLETHQARQFYTVLETSQGDMILTERLSGRTAWAENPSDLEYRNSLAKVVRVADCRAANITVAEMMGRHAEEADSAASQSGCKRHAHGVFLSVLPAGRRPWSVLKENERQQAQQFGISTAEQWDLRTAQVWKLTWRELTEEQRGAALTLGFSKTAWRRKAERSLGGVWEKSWVKLSEVERCAAKTLGIASPNAWDQASWDELKQEAGSVWEKSWAQLTQAQREAAKQLGIAGAEAWDESAWLPGSAWEETWANLTHEEQQAAQLLGVQSAVSWDSAFGGAGRRGQGLEGVWSKSWAQLTVEEQQAAKFLGIAGAGAWDKSMAKSSTEKQVARMSEAEQKAMMEEWFKSHCNSLAGAGTFVA